MAVNISNPLNQYNNAVSQSTVQQGSPQLSQSTNTPSAVNSGLQLFKEMLAGDTFTGKVMGMEDGNVLLTMNNGKSLLAHLSENATVQVGQNLTFMVENNNGANITIKPMAMDSQQSLLINRALDAAGFPVSEANAEMVKELLNLNMPINSETISEMIKNANKFPEANLNTIANLMKLDIPVTENNIAQFEAYKSYEHSITSELNNMVNGFSELIKSDTAGAGLLGEISNMLYASENSSSESLMDSLGQESVDNLVKMLENARTDNLDSVINSLKDGRITTKQFINDISALLRDNPELKEQLKELLDSDDFSKIIKQMIDETMKLTPQDVSKEDGIKKYYKRMSEIADNVAEKLADSQAGQKLSADMDSIKSNIDFMNDLNKNMTYFQMPIKFQHGDANGELYVFTNKRALKAGSDNVSALLHLDMDNLGPVDVYVKLAGNNVSTNFCLESEEMLDFVYSHIDKLNKRLEELGYNCHFDMKVAEAKDIGEPSFDFVKDFIEKDTNNLSTTQYILDVKA
ncbi:MAG: flagellar hook-length control protein FliK [Lachnospira sp.]|nr:flagellar hook-length control protein FliK [Lachnospira sp.]